ncbi:MAG: hypothetical protein O4804_06100 [Trichodesmium sp. St11_bin5]|nr:hypothetical protein [Trichodesmium sp. St11_bin5]MDT9340328.1 hypothetical protein [Trichodesmium erythraeum 21-75]
MVNAEQVSYGNYYWYVRVTKDIVENQEQYVQADEAQIKDGILLFLKYTNEGAKVTMAFAPGTWLTAFVTTYKIPEN